LIFTLSLLIIQVSCQKSIAWNTEASTQLNKLLFTTSDRKIWTCNYDGSNVTEINLNMPTNYKLQLNIPSFHVVLSPDGQKVFYNANPLVTNPNDPPVPLRICSSDISGTGFSEIVVGNAQIKDPLVFAAY
jgi:hypothetical protein